MKLSYYCFEKPIEFKENTINVLIIENQKMFRDFLIMLINGCEGYDTELVLSEEKILSMEKCAEIVLSPFSIDLNCKKVLSKLHDHLSRFHDDYEDTFNKLAYSMNQFGCELAMRSQYSIVFTEIQNIQQIIKALDFKLDGDIPINERIIEYMRIYRDLLGKKLFIFVNLKNYFTSEECELLYKDIIAEKFDVLLLEGHQYTDTVYYEKTRIIDADLCELY